MPRRIVQNHQHITAPQPFIEEIKKILKRLRVHRGQDKAFKHPRFRVDGPHHRIPKVIAAVVTGFSLPRQAPDQAKGTVTFYPRLVAEPHFKVFEQYFEGLLEFRCPFFIPLQRNLPGTDSAESQTMKITVNRTSA